MRTSTMAKGDVVTIYKDPLTKKKPEGRARLVKEIGKHSSFKKITRWTVKFLSDGFVCDRFI